MSTLAITKNVKVEQARQVKTEDEQVWWLACLRIFNQTMANK